MNLGEIARPDAVVSTNLIDRGHQVEVVPAFGGQLDTRQQLIAAAQRDAPDAGRRFDGDVVLRLMTHGRFCLRIGEGDQMIEHALGRAVGDRGGGEFEAVFQ